MTSPQWRKSSHSGPEQGACVEVAGLGAGIGVRDSKDPHGPHLTLTPETFGLLVRGIKETRVS